MSLSNVSEYPRSAATILVLGLLAAFLVGEWRVELWHQLLPFFEWMETTPFGVIGKTWGAAFAVIEAFHLLAMAILGGAVITADLRLLDLAFTDIDGNDFADKAHRLFCLALLLIIFTGVFMACGVALKIYYLPVYWYKMLALLTGIVFVFFIRRPLLRHPQNTLRASVRYCVAITSLAIWFTVAATGRWIGFSG